jgi:hypothetical protein
MIRASEAQECEIMPDISMCNGSGCVMKAMCYRFGAVPSDRQSWFTKVPWENVEDRFHCNYFWDMRKEVKSDRN